MKKITSILLSLMTIFAVSLTAFAYSETKVYNEYIQYKNSGILGEDISFEIWLDMIEQNEEQLQAFEESGLFEEVYDSRTSNSASFLLKEGDVILTSSSNTGWFGLTGHAGIAVSSSTMLHIPGDDQATKISTLSAWLNDFSDGYTKVYRCTSQSVGVSASNRALYLYGPVNGIYKNATYQVTQDFDSYDPVYCSKLVWLAYRDIGQTTDPGFPYYIGVFSLPNYIRNIPYYATL